MKKLILLDLDNTLFDSAAYRTNLFQKIASSLNLKDIDIFSLCQKIYDEMIKDIGLMDPDLFVEQFEKATGNAGYKEKIREFLFDPEFMKDHVHKEVIEELPKLALVAEIGILSQGETRLQMAKISSLSYLFKPALIHIERDKKSQMEKIFMTYQEYTIFFVDDMLPMLYEARLINPGIITIWIKRGRYALNQEPLPDFKPNAQIETLSEVLDIIKKVS